MTASAGWIDQSVMKVSMNRMIFVLLGAAFLLPGQIRLRPVDMRKQATMAQSASQDEPNQWLSSPILGYVTYENARFTGGGRSCGERSGITQPLKVPCRGRPEVRAILGVPEASYLSDAIELPEFAHSVAFAPGHEWAIVFRGGQAPALAWSPENGALGTFDGVLSHPDLLAFSPSGTEAALYWRDTQQLAIYSVLPTGISMVQRVSSNLLPADLDRFAVSDGGAAVAALTSSGAVFVVSRGGFFPVPLYDSQGLVDFTFRSKSPDLILSDSVAEKVLLFEKIAGIYGSRTLLTAGDGLAAPSFVSAVENGLVLVSSQAANRIWSVDPSTGVTIATDATVTRRFEKLRVRGSFLISSESGDPGWIYQSTVDGPKVTFVPATQRTRQEK